MIRPVLVFISGGLFGTGLAISGMTNPARVLGFLDVTGKWDPTLCFVMAGALAAFAFGSYALRRRGRGLNDVRIAPSFSDPINFQLLTGAAIFGIGWGLAGFCPGPSLANLGALRTQSLVFVPMMALGMILAQRLFGADRS